MSVGMFHPSIPLSVCAGEGERGGCHGNGAQQEGGETERGRGHAAAAGLQGLHLPSEPHRGKDTHGS